MRTSALGTSTAQYSLIVLQCAFNRRIVKIKVSRHENTHDNLVRFKKLYQILEIGSDVMEMVAPLSHRGNRDQ